MNYIPNKRPKETLFKELPFDKEYEAIEQNTKAKEYIKKRKIGNIIDFKICEKFHKNIYKQYTGMVKAVYQDKFLLSLNKSHRKIMIYVNDIVDGSYEEVKAN